MDFLKRKISRVGYTLCHYQVTIKPTRLELVVDQPGEVWVTLKRGRHKEKTNKQRVNVQGFGRQNISVTYGDAEALVRVSDFYKKNDVFQDKKAKF